MVDECHLFLAPIVVGAGNQSLPGNVRLTLELLDERRFGNGVIYLRYRTTTERDADAASAAQVTQQGPRSV